MAASKLGRGKARILVIDDDELVRSLFRKTPANLGHRVIAAETSPEGPELVKQEDFDMVFLDPKMPGMDGAELSCRIKTIKTKLRVTIITSYPESDMMVRALAQGPFGVMNKPFGAPDIVIAANVFIPITRARTAY